MCPWYTVLPYLDWVQAIGQIHKLWRDKVIFSIRRHSRELRSSSTRRLTARSIDSQVGRLVAPDLIHRAQTDQVSVQC